MSPGRRTPIHNKQFVHCATVYFLDSNLDRVSKSFNITAGYEFQIAWDQEWRLTSDNTHAQVQSLMPVPNPLLGPTTVIPRYPL